MAKLNDKTAPITSFDSESDEDSFLFDFFSSSSSFLSTSSFSDFLWSETSFSFSSDGDSQENDNASDLTHINTLAFNNVSEKETDCKYSTSREKISPKEKCIKNYGQENNSSQNNINLSAQKITPKIQLDFSSLEVPKTESHTFTCDICGNEFNSQATLDVHKLNHLVSETYVCEICDRISKNREDYILHFRHHTDNSFEFSGRFLKNKKLLHVPYTCKICGKTFRFLSSFKRHVEKHTLSHICSICKASFPTELLCHQHKLQHVNKKVYKCEECNKIFQRPHQLTIHMQVHKNDKKYHCKECDTTYCYKTSLLRHSLKYHSPNSQKFQCNVCGELFKTKKMLNCHVILHTAKKLIQCTDCSQTFKYRSSYHRHRTIHQGSMPFRCNTCGKLLKSESHLKIHKAQHIANDKFVCTICDKSFGLQSFLDQHMLIHELKCNKDSLADQSG